MAEDFVRDLELLIRSRHPLIFLETDEKDRAQGLLMHVADRMQMPFWSWTRTKGLRPPQQKAADRDTLSPLDALAQVEAMFRPGLFNFQGLGDELGDRVVATRLRDAVRPFGILPAKLARMTVSDRPSWPPKGGFGSGWLVHGQAPDATGAARFIAHAPPDARRKNALLALSIQCRSSISTTEGPAPPTRQSR